MNRAFNHFDADGFGPAIAPADVRVASRRAVAEAIASNLIERPVHCGRCGKAGDIHAHHRSYRPEHALAVVWLCVDCHAGEHSRLIALRLQPANTGAMTGKVAVAAGASVKALTERQAEILGLIIGGYERDGWPPTFREIAEMLGICSTNGVNDHLNALERKGYIERAGLKSRGLRVLRYPDGTPYQRAA